MAATDTTTESTQVSSPEEGTEVESQETQPRAKRKPPTKQDIAFRQVQSERDRLRNESQQNAQRMSAVEYQSSQLRQQLDDLTFRAQVSGLPEDQQQVAVAQRQWDTLQRQLAQERQARQMIESQHNQLASNTGRVALIAEAISKYRPPAEVAGTPIMEFLVWRTRNAQTAEELDSLVAQVASENTKPPKQPKAAKVDDTKKPKAKKAGANGATPATPKPETPGGRYMGAEGQSIPPITWSQRTSEDRAKRWKEAKEGRRTFASLND